MPRPSWMTWRPKERLWTWPLLTSSQPFSAASKWPSSHPMIPSNLEKPLNLFGSAGVLHWALRGNKLTFYSYNLSHSPHHLHDTFPSIPWLPSVTLWVWNIMKQYETFSYRSILVYILYYKENNRISVEVENSHSILSFVQSTMLSRALLLSWHLKLRWSVSRNVPCDLAVIVYNNVSHWDYLARRAAWCWIENLTSICLLCLLSKCTVYTLVCQGSIIIRECTGK